MSTDHGRVISALQHLLFAYAAIFSCCVAQSVAVSHWFLQSVNKFFPLWTISGNDSALMRHANCCHWGNQICSPLMQHTMQYVKLHQIDHRSHRLNFRTIPSLISGGSRILNVLCRQHASSSTAHVSCEHDLRQRFMDAVQHRALPLPEMNTLW